jgi:hypothetical protein
MLGARGITIAATLTFAGVAWWAGRGEQPPVRAPVQAASAAPDPTTIHRTIARESAVRDDAVAAATPPEDGSELASEAKFVEYVDGKYHFLLESVARSPRGSQGLRAALVERENIVAAINTARQGADPAERQDLPRRLQALADMDRRIGAMLPAADLAAFEALKDSHIEQFQLNDYAQGISNVAPLSEADRKAILYAKLAWRQRFRQALNDSGLMRGDLTVAERQVVLGHVTRALENTHESFLQEARQYLYDDEQFALLRNYENSEYAAELEKLKHIAAGS